MGKECPFVLYVLNLPESQDRMQKIADDLTGSPAVRVKRIEAVNGFDLANVPDDEFLQDYKHLKGSTMYCQGFSETWIYDGTLTTAFPGLSLGGHQGDKGLTLSNLRAMKAALASDQLEEWVCIAEDDAELPPVTMQEIVKIVNTTTDQDILWFDERYRIGGEDGSGTVFVCYRKSILPQLIEDMHPLSDFSRGFEATFKRGNLWDWQLYAYANTNHRLKLHPLVKSGRFPSLITPQR